MTECVGSGAKRAREDGDDTESPKRVRVDDAQPYDDATKARLREIVAQQAAAVRERALERARQLCPDGFGANGAWRGVSATLPSPPSAAVAAVATEALEGGTDGRTKTATPPPP